MALNFPKSPAKYSDAHLDQVQRQLETEDKKNIKLGTVLDKILMRDTSTGKIVTVVMTDGALDITVPT